MTATKKKLLFLAALNLSVFQLAACAHRSFSASGAKGASIAHVPVDKKVEFPRLGLTMVIKDKSAGAPIAAIFDKKGEFYPELQNRMNREMKASARVGLTVISAEIKPENGIYKESREEYATLIINAKTVNGLNKKSQNLKFAVPIERMLIAEKGGKASGLGYWNTTEVRALDPAQPLPF